MGLRDFFGNGALGDDYEFPVPTVEYTVPEPEQKPEEQPAASAPQEDAPQSGGEQGGE